MVSSIFFEIWERNFDFLKKTEKKIVSYEFFEKSQSLFTKLIFTNLFNFFVLVCFFVLIIRRQKMIVCIERQKLVFQPNNPLEISGF